MLMYRPVLESDISDGGLWGWRSVGLSPAVLPLSFAVVLSQNLLALLFCNHFVLVHSSKGLDASEDS